MSINQLSALQRLIDYCQKYSIFVDIVVKINETSPKDENRRNLAKIYLNMTKTVVARAYGSTAFEAKCKAAERALTILLERSRQIESSTCFYRPAIPDQFSQIVIEWIENHSEKIPNGFYAAFLLKKSENDRGKIVAFAAGSRCSSNDSSTDDGETLIDCHAVALARRSLLKYFYDQLNRLIDGESPLRNIFVQPTSSGGKFSFRQQISLHLILSDAPSGDAREFLPSNSNQFLNAYDAVQLRLTGHVPIYETNDQGQLRYKYQQGLETISARNRQEFGIMSCSDKILKWNFLGLQGSLLSNLIEPIKISSITHLSGFKQEHTCRAYCCRLNSIEGQSHVHHPQLYRTKKSILSSNHFDHQWSYSWSIVHQGELIDASIGRLNSGSTSCLTKFSFLKDFKHLSMKLCRSCYVHYTYYQLKRLNRDYDERKQSMIKFLEDARFGFWTSEKIHFEQFKYLPKHCSR